MEYKTERAIWLYDNKSGGPATIFLLYGNNIEMFRIYFWNNHWYICCPPMRRIIRDYEHPFSCIIFLNFL